MPRRGKKFPCENIFSIAGCAEFPCPARELSCGPANNDSAFCSVLGAGTAGFSHKTCKPTKPLIPPLAHNVPRQDFPHFSRLNRFERKGFSSGSETEKTLVSQDFCWSSRAFGTSPSVTSQPLETPTSRKQSMIHDDRAFNRSKRLRVHSGRRPRSAQHFKET